MKVVAAIMKMTLLEHDAARWLPLNDLRQMKWLPADLEIIEEIEKKYKQ